MRGRELHRGVEGEGGIDGWLLKERGEGGGIGDPAVEDEGKSYSDTEGHLGFFLQVLERRRCFKIIS